MLRLTGSALALVAASLAGTASPQEHKPPIFQASVEMIRLSITVQDSHGRYITDLHASDFSIIENGTKQDITDFRYQELPLDLTFLLDTSDSMNPHLKEIYQAVARFVEAIQPDTVQIVQFAQSALVVQPQTDDMVEIGGSLAKLTLFSEYGRRIKNSVTINRSKKPEDIILREALREWLCNRAMCGTTALHTGIYSTIKFLKRTASEESDTRRQALILFTDGEDTASSLTADDVLKEVAHLETPIYAFNLHLDGSPGDTLQTDNFLTPLTTKTGGRYETITLAANLVPWYRRIADELRSQYHIGYATSNIGHNGLWRPIQVSVGRAGYAIRHKEGYYAPCDPGQPCAQKKR